MTLNMKSNYSGMNIMASIFTIILSFLVLTCRPIFYEDNNVKPPEVRIGIMEHENSVEFKINSEVNFTKRDNSIVMRNLQSGRWKVETLNAKPAEFIYRLAVGTTKDRIQAEKIARSVYKKGLNAHVKKHDRSSNINIPYFEKAIYRVVLDKDFKNRNDAIAYQNTIRGKTGSKILEVPKDRSEGALRFTHLDSKYSFDLKEEAKFSTNNIEIIGVEVGSGFHWESKENRVYSGTLEFVVDNYGQITVINELSLEEYLKGVVPSEMPVRFPYEALKAQAVAARVEAIAKVGLRHPLEPFDLCDDVHCQVFSGNSKISESTNNAVESTRGIFMVHRKKIVEAFYAAVCGGHSENNDNVWLMDAKPFLRGVLDRGGRGNERLSTSLQKEQNVKKWIDSSPEVFCNTTRRKLPASLNYSKKYFRWQVEYKRTELEEIIRTKTGENFGQLRDLIPQKRGVSGRLIELLVVGTKKQFKISRELAIRRALSKNTLYSASFYVKKEGGSRNLPKKFILKGAGWGHGVGMCQIGAAVMALSDKKFDEILEHYYKGIILEILYD